MAELEPSINSSTEPVSIWLFARRIAGRECDAYIAWHDAKRGSMRAVDFDRVTASVKRRWPSLDETQLFLRELKVLDDRAARLRGWAWHLLATVIPSKVRRELLRGGYRITGRNSAGKRVLISLDDLAGLNVDLGSNCLIGPTTAFTDVSVRPLEYERRSEPSEEIEALSLTSEVVAPSDIRPGSKPIGKVPVATQAYDQMKGLLLAQEASLPRGRKFPRGVRSQLTRDLARRLGSDESTVRKAVQSLFDEWERKYPGN
jgi:hypothetical protein